MSKFYKVLIGPATNIVTSGGGGDGVQTVTGDGVGGTPENVIISFPNQLEVQAIRPIKTVNNESLEGVGNIVIQGGGGGENPPEEIPQFTTSLPFDKSSQYINNYTQISDISFSIENTDYGYGASIFVTIQTNGDPINFDSNFYLEKNDYSSFVSGIYDLFFLLGTDGKVRVAIVDTLASFNNPPNATNVLIGGSPILGGQLSGSYNYNDIENDPEQGTGFAWYRSDDNTGSNESAIIGAVAQDYVSIGDDLNKYLRFSVTPKNSVATGQEYFSPYTQEITQQDDQPPTVNFIPSDGSTNQNTSINIEIVFNESVRLIGGGEITNSNLQSLISLEFPQLMQQIPFSASINEGKTIITLVPSSELLNNREVRVTIVNLEDSSSNSIGGSTVSSFSTESGVFNAETIGDVSFLLYSDSITDVDGSEVTTWSDSSLQVKPATSSSGTSPIAETSNGQKVLRFNGLNQIMDVAQVSALGGVNVNSSFFVVCKASSPNTGDRAPLGTYQGSSNTNNLVPVVYNDSLETEFGYKDNTVERIFNGYYNDGIDIWVFNIKEGLVDVYKNGVKVSTEYDITGFNIGQAVTIGGMKKAQDPAGKYFFEGDIYAVGAYYKQLSFSDIDYIQTGLSNKYGVPLFDEKNPLYIDDTELVYALEARSILLNSKNNGIALDNIYPVNLGNGKTRMQYRLSTFNKNMVFSELSGIRSIKLDGNQLSTYIGLSSLSSSMLAGTIDQPICLFLACSFDDVDRLQTVFGLGNSNSVNNNLMLIEKSATNELGYHRRATTNKPQSSISPLDNSRHIICVNVKNGGLIDAWIDGVKVGSDLDGTTNNTLSANQAINFGNNQQGLNAFKGDFELGYIYGESKTDQYVLDTFSSINSELNVY